MEFNKPKKSGNSKKYIIAVIALLLLGGLFYYLTAPTEDNSTPPTVEVSGDGLQGMIAGGQFSLAAHDSDDEDDYEDELDDWLDDNDEDDMVTLEGGEILFMYAAEDTDLRKLLFK